MKFVVTSDWHIKVNRDAPESWSLNRYRLLFQEMIKACLENDAWLLIAGDLADTVSLRLPELNLYLELFHLLEENKVHTILIGGNHCEVGQDKALFDYFHLDKFGPIKGCSYIHYNEGPHIFEDFSLAVIPVSHHQLSLLDEIQVDAKFKILLSHIRGTLNQFIVEEVPISEIEKNFDLVLLGDLHGNFQLSEKTWYTNAPINSQYDSKPDCGYILLTVQDGAYNIQRVKTDLPALVSINTVPSSFALDTGELNNKDFYKITVTGQLSELKKLPNSLPNAKIVKVAEQDITYQTEDEPEANLEQSHSTLEEELLAHMVSLDYNESLIKNMITELRDL